MDVPAKALSLIRQFEGYRDKIYLDTGGLPTIGWGHLIKRGENFSSGITKEQAESLLLSDATSAMNIVLKFVKIPLNENQLAALIDFVYNLGGTHFQNSTLLRRVNLSMLLDIEHAFMLWVYGIEKGKPTKLPGLVTRRSAEVAMFHTPIEKGEIQS